MDKKLPRPMTPFDELVTSQELQMMKLFLPYTPSSNQQFLGVFIKFIELQDTISFFRNINNNLHTHAFSRSQPPSPMEMLQELQPYMPPEQTEMMDTFLNMMNIMEMAQTFQGASPDSGNASSSHAEGSGSGFGGLNPMDMMMSMMTPDQQNMFQMYNNIFANEMDSMENESTKKEPLNKESDEYFVQKGDDTDE